MRSITTCFTLELKLPISVIWNIVHIICPLLVFSQIATWQSASCAEMVIKADAKGDLSRWKVIELIDKLQEESKEGVGSHSTAWASGFLAIDEEPQFHGGVLGSHKPTTSPVMKELVRRGIAALPELIDHLNDKRATKLVIKDTFGMGNLWHSDEYDLRFYEPKKCPPGVNTGLEKFEGIENPKQFSRQYSIRVGDLCYVAIGQIVNRNLNVVRYQPTACIVINSPVQTPTLAAAVKRDWAGITVDQHKKSLSQDALRKDTYATASAMVRVLFYYPPEGEVLALKLLARPLYNNDALWDFIMKHLVKVDDPVEWKAMVEGFRKAQGQAAVDALPFQLHWIYWETSFKRNKDFLESKDRATKILALLYQKYDPYNPYFINAATPEEQVDLIHSLAKFQSDKIDQSVYRIFQSTTQKKEILDLDSLCLACMSRLVGKGHEGEFRDFVDRRIMTVEALPKKSDGRDCLEAFRHWQERLKK